MKVCESGHNIENYCRSCKYFSCRECTKSHKEHLSSLVPWQSIPNEYLTKCQTAHYRAKLLLDSASTPESIIKEYERKVDEAFENVIIRMRVEYGKIREKMCEELMTEEVMRESKSSQSRMMDIASKISRTITELIDLKENKWLSIEYARKDDLAIYDKSLQREATLQLGATHIEDEKIRLNLERALVQPKLKAYFIIGGEDQSHGRRIKKNIRPVGKEESEGEGNRKREENKGENEILTPDKSMRFSSGKSSLSPKNLKNPKTHNAQIFKGKTEGSSLPIAKPSSTVQITPVKRKSSYKSTPSSSVSLSVEPPPYKRVVTQKSPFAPLSPRQKITPNPKDSLITEMAIVSSMSGNISKTSNTKYKSMTEVPHSYKMEKQAPDSSLNLSKNTFNLYPSLKGPKYEINYVWNYGSKTITLKELKVGSLSKVFCVSPKLPSSFIVRIIVKKLGSGLMRIGVVKKHPVRAKIDFGREDNEWAYTNNGTLEGNPVCQIDTFGDADIIEIRHTLSKELVFAKDKSLQQALFENVKGTFYLAVAMFQSGQQIELLSVKHIV